MLSLLVAMMLAASLGPMGPDAPALEPQMAANGSIVGLSFGAGNGIYFSASHDSGKTFSAPVKVAEAEIVPLTRHRGPRIVFSGGTILISAVTGRRPSQEPHAHGLPSDGDLMVWRSMDGGKSWSMGTIVNDVPGAPTEGLHSLASDGKSTVFAAWLDKRSGKGTQLYGARSNDAGATWSKNIRIYRSPEGTICECCHPSVAVDPAGQIFVMWRNWLAGSRDMYLARSNDGVTFTKPEKLGIGTWKLNGCPMDGGGLVISQGHVVTAWRRENALYIAEPGGRETSIGEGKDITMAAGAKGVYGAWVDSSGIELTIPGAAQPTKLSNTGAYPALASLADGSILAAWEDNGRIVTSRVN
jgi:hypothetical protein